MSSKHWIFCLNKAEFGQLNTSKKLVSICSSIGALSLKDFRDKAPTEEDLKKRKMSEINEKKRTPSCSDKPIKLVSSSPDFGNGCNILRFWKTF